MVIDRSGRLLDESWTHVSDDERVPESGSITVSLQRWCAERASLKDRAQPVGLRLEGGDDPATAQHDLAEFPLIVLHFAYLGDGRLFSLARLLRERYAYRGRLQAAGDFLLDQMQFLARVGVDAFELSPEANIGETVAALSTFSVTYQPATDDVRPLFRRARRGTA